MKKDYTGQTYGRLTFIRPTEKKCRKNIVWELLCECGNTTYVIGSMVTSGNTSSCGCYRKERLAKSCRILGKKSRKYEPMITSAHVVWGNYKECDFDTFFRLSRQPCYYCECPPSNLFNAGSKPSGGYYNSDYQKQYGDFTYNGLDRIDSTKGHLSDNVVPCCFDCNRAKSNHTLEEFLAHIERMYEGTRRLKASLSSTLLGRTG